MLKSVNSRYRNAFKMTKKLIKSKFMSACSAGMLYRVTLSSEHCGVFSFIYIFILDFHSGRKQVCPPQPGKLTVSHNIEQAQCMKEYLNKLQRMKLLEAKVH